MPPVWQWPKPHRPSWIAIYDRCDSSHHRGVEAQITVDNRVGVQPLTCQEPYFRATTYCEPPFRKLPPAQMLRRLWVGQVNMSILV